MRSCTSASKDGLTSALKWSLIVSHEKYGGRDRGLETCLSRIFIMLVGFAPSLRLLTYVCIHSQKIRRLETPKRGGLRVLKEFLEVGTDNRSQIGLSPRFEAATRRLGTRTIIEPKLDMESLRYRRSSTSTTLRRDFTDKCEGR